MEDLLGKIEESIETINKYSKIKPEIAIILGTGLGRLAKDIQDSISIPYHKIKNFPKMSKNGWASIRIEKNLPPRQFSSESFPVKMTTFFGCSLAVSQY